jgi:hypothetical protein
MSRTSTQPQAFLANRLHQDSRREPDRGEANIARGVEAEPFEESRGVG